MAYKLYLPCTPVCLLQELHSLIPRMVFCMVPGCPRTRAKLSLTLSHLMVGGDAGGLLIRVSGHHVSLWWDCRHAQVSHVQHAVAVHARCGMFLCSKYTQDTHLLFKHSWGST